MRRLWISDRQSVMITFLVSSLITAICSQTWTTSDQDPVLEQDGYRNTEASSLATIGNIDDLAKGWEAPDFAIVYSGRQQGYIEPCGCTGLENQYGGILRRHTAIETLQQRGWPMIKVDAGDQVKRFGQQPMIKLEKTYQALLEIMDYDVIALGAGELKIPSIDLAQLLVNVPQPSTPFVSANIEVVHPDLSQRFKVLERGGKRIGVTAILGDESIDELSNTEGVSIQQMRSALTDVLPKMIAQNCDAFVLVAGTSIDNCRALAQQFPQFDLIITTDCAGDPTLEPQFISTPRGNLPLVQVGIKSMYLGLIGFYVADSGWKIRYERIPLDARFEDSEPVKQVFISYQNELRRLWEGGRFADIKPRRHPSGNQFVGSEACADCHGVEYEIWEQGNNGNGGPHKHATASLTEPNQRSWVQRHFDPECVSCHMTGWDPQGYFPFETGYMDHAKDQHLFDNGCENCHGPGSGHIQAERNQAANPIVLEKFREQVRVTLEEARQNACMECHDLDNSPDFLKEGGFDRYWPEIEH